MAGIKIVRKDILLDIYTVIHKLITGISYDAAHDRISNHLDYRSRYRSKFFLDKVFILFQLYPTCTGMQPVGCIRTIRFNN